MLFARLALWLAVGATLAAAGPEYTGGGELKFPAKYREWIYLTSGFDMSYSPKAEAAGHSLFDNVFVNPEAYAAFLETGTWPDKTVMVLEVRGAEGRGSINQRGHYQSSEVTALEVHVKNGGQWAFFSFDNKQSAKLIPATASCYSCHAGHAAVDTTFVQFYPTLLDIAKSKGTLSEAYRKEPPATVK